MSRDIVGISLDVLIDQRHAVELSKTGDNAGNILAFVEIGGVDDVDGVITIGVTGMAETGVSDQAIRSYNEANADRTDVAFCVILPR